MSTESLLISETAKWLKKAEIEFSKTKPADKNHLAGARSLPTAPLAVGKGEEFIKNIAAYIDDSMHFTQKKDHVRAFEAIIWAWAWIEIGKDIGVLK
ncbi:Uncharacterised protein [uncultured archaeon]|nr:Uncharacterised protein [uncultured archaeon]